MAVIFLFLKPEEIFFQEMFINSNILYNIRNLKTKILAAAAASRRSQQSAAKRQLIFMKIFFASSMSGWISGYPAQL